MDILNRIILLLGDKDQKELMDYLGLKKCNFSDWKAGRSKSYTKYIFEIAKFFNVSIDFLVYGEKEPYDSLTKNEKEIIDIFRQFPEREQVKVIGRLESLLEEQQRSQIVGVKIARRTDGEAIRNNVTAEELEKIMQLPEETDF